MNWMAKRPKPALPMTPTRSRALTFWRFSGENTVALAHSSGAATSDRGERARHAHVVGVAAVGHDAVVVLEIVREHSSVNWTLSAQLTHGLGGKECHRTATRTSEGSGNRGNASKPRVEGFSRTFLTTSIRGMRNQLAVSSCSFSSPSMSTRCCYEDSGNRELKRGSGV